MHGVGRAAAAEAHAAERAALAADYDRRVARLEQEASHKLRAAERKHSKKCVDAC
jgi:hypothetical protein